MDVCMDRRINIGLFLLRGRVLPCNLHFFVINLTKFLIFTCLNPFGFY